MDCVLTAPDAELYFREFAPEFSARYSRVVERGEALLRLRQAHALAMPVAAEDSRPVQWFAVLGIFMRLLQGRSLDINFVEGLLDYVRSAEAARKLPNIFATAREHTENVHV